MTLKQRLDRLWRESVIRNPVGAALWDTNDVWFLPPEHKQVRRLPSGVHNPDCGIGAWIYEL